MKSLSITAIALSSVAILLSGYAVIKPNPIGKGIDAYDFSSPEEALKSELLIQKSGDLLAQTEYQVRRSLKDIEARDASMEIHDSSDYDGKKILFISYLEDGKSKYDTRSFEKDSETGNWYYSYVSTYGMPDNSDMKKRIEAWEAKSEK